MATGWLWEERYAWHDAGTWNDFASTPANAYVQPQTAFENPETKRRFPSRSRARPSRAEIIGNSPNTCPVGLGG